MSPVPLVRHEARVAADEGDRPRAVALLDEADEHYRPGFCERPTHRGGACPRLDRGRPRQGLRLGLDRGLAPGDEPTYLTEYEHLTLARLLIAPGSDVTGLLTRLSTAAEVSGRKGLTEINTLLAATATTREQAPPGMALTTRELEVLRLLDSELTAPQIAQRLFVSHNTLRTHTKHIFTKLAVTTRRAAVARARERGLIGDGTPGSHPVHHIEG